MAAASRGNVEVLQILLAAGAAVNARDQSKVSALMLAALSSSEDAVLAKKMVARATSISFCIRRAYSARQPVAC